MNRRLCFVAPPFAGHLYPMLPLAQGARDAGYDVEVITGEAKLAAVQSAGLRAETLRALAPGVLETISNTPRKVGSDPVRLAAQMRVAFGLMRSTRDELVERWRGRPPDLVIADFTAVPAGLAADAVGAPWISTLRGAFVLEGRDGPPSYVGGLKPASGPLGQVRDRLGWAAVRSVKDALAWLFRREMDRIGLRRLRPDGSEAIYSRRAILALDMAELEFPRAWPPALRFIGPLADNPEPPLALAPPMDGPRILVSLGTHLPWAKRTLVEDVRALAAKFPDTRFVVSLGDAAKISALPRHVESNLIVYSFVPYRAEMPGFDAIVHHGGAGVTSAAIAAGKPSLVIPHDYDQFDYAARVEHHGLGLRARGIGSGDAAMKLARLLREPLPALPIFAAHAARYRPIERFLDIAAALIGSREGAAA